MITVHSQQFTCAVHHPIAHSKDQCHQGRQSADQLQQVSHGVPTAKLLYQECDLGVEGPAIQSRKFCTTFTFCDKHGYIVCQ